VRVPYRLQREGSGYVVVNSDTGKRHSNKPLPRSRAVAQMRLLYAAENGTSTKAANYGAKVGEQIAGRLIRAAGGRFGSGDAAADPAKTQAEAAATIAHNRALNAAAAKPGGRKHRVAKPHKARAKKPHTGHVAKPKKTRARSASGKRRDLARQVMHHGRVAKALGLMEDAAGSLLDLAQGKKVTDDGGLEKMGLAVAQKDGTFKLTAAGEAVAKAADAGDVKAARTVMDAISTTTKDTGHTGVMLAFFLPGLVASELAQQTSAAGVATPEPVDDLHLTLAYLGKASDLADSKYQILAGAERYARYASAVMGTVSGIGRFDTDEGDGTNALYASFDAPDLSAWRDNLIQELANQSATLPAANHGYTPHITLAYVPADAPTPMIPVGQLPITFDTLTVAWGDERIDFPLLRSSPMVFKDKHDRWRWVTFSSTAYRDRDGEIVSTKALADDVARADADGQYGPLRWWHMPGVDIGDCDFNAVTGRVLVESGTFRDERIGERIKAAASDLQVSIGFHHAPTEPVDGVFSSIRRFERSLLPAGRASNPYTRLLVQETPSMDQPKQDALKALLGDDKLLEQLLTQAEATTKAADAAGVAFKAAAPMPTEAPDDPADEAADAAAGITEEEDVVAIGDMAPVEFQEMLTDALQPVADAIKLLAGICGGMVSTMTGVQTKEAAVETRLTEVETKAAAVPDLTTQLATTKAALEAAQAEIAELKGDLPKSVNERRASQATATVLTPEQSAQYKSDDAQPRGDPNFINSFVLGQPVQQGA
jgi:2'-5' RNA ligase